VNRPPIGRIGRIGTGQIRVNPSNPPNPWSIHPSDASNTDLGHYPGLRSGPDSTVYANS